MKTVRTMYRLAVMAATLAIAVMAWRLYGPPPERCKDLMSRGVSYVQSLLAGPAAPARDKSSPRLLPLEQSKSHLGPSPSALSTAPPLYASGSDVPPSRPPAVSPIAPAEFLPGSQPAATLPISAAPFATIGMDATPSSTGSAMPSLLEDRLMQSFARLAELDVQEPQLSPWGKSGRLFRFCCRATLEQSPDFTRHFESVAASPSEAVEEVLAQVSAWRDTALAAQ